jgi:hypothetical protein
MNPAVNPAITVPAMSKLIVAVCAIYAVAYGFVRVARDRDARFAPFDRDRFKRQEAENAAGGKHERTCPAHPQWTGLEERRCRCDWIRERRAARLQRA